MEKTLLQYLKEVCLEEPKVKGNFLVIEPEYVPYDDMVLEPLFDNGNVQIEGITQNIELREFSKTNKLRITYKDKEYFMCGFNRGKFYFL